MKLNVSTKELAEFWGITIRRIAQLTKDGEIKKTGTKYKLKETNRAYCDFLKRGATQRGSKSFEEEKLRKLKEEADKLERERLKDEGRMIDSEEVYKTFEKVFVSIRQKILAEVQLSGETKAEILNNLKAIKSDV